MLKAVVKSPPRQYSLNVPELVVTEQHLPCPSPASTSFRAHESPDSLKSPHDTMEEGSHRVHRGMKVGAVTAAMRQFLPPQLAWS